MRIASTVLKTIKSNYTRNTKTNDSSYRNNKLKLNNSTFPTILRLLEICRVRESGHLPNLTSAEKIQLKLTWDQFKQGDNAKTGFDMFLK